MITVEELAVLTMCIEWFLYGKISFLCAVTCTPAKEVQLFPDLGIYSGIFAIYLQFTLLKESRTTSIVFYALCALHILSTVTVVSDLITCIIQVSNSSIYKNINFYQLLCRHVSVHYQFNFKLTYSQCYFVFRLSKSQ